MPSILGQISDCLSLPIAGTPIAGWHLVWLSILVLPFVLVATVFRKQWDRTPGVWKCMILSAIAHFGLLVVAYSTQYHVIAGAKANGDATPIKVIDSDERIDLADEESAPKVESWDQFTGEQPTPQINPLERPREEPELMVERVWDSSPPVVAENSAELSAEMPVAPELKMETTKPNDLPMLSGFDPVLPKTTSPTPTPIDRDVNAQESASPPIETAQLAASTPPLEIPMDLPQPETIIAQNNADAAPLPPNDRMLDELTSPSTNPVPSQPASFEKDQSRPLFIPRRFGDSQPMPKIYALRIPEGRLQTVEEQGGSVETEQAVEAALAYMAAIQSPDGRWSSRLTNGGIERKVLGHDRQGAGSRADCGITGLAVLAFLSAGHTQFEGKYKQTVASALQFLSDHQAPDGCLAGEAQLFERTYCHSMATLAISEALAVTGDAKLTPIVRRAVDYSVRSQSTIDGGWRYQPGDSGDMSQFGWKVLALHSASLGGIEIPDATLAGMHKFLEHCTRGSHKGLGCYRPGDAHTPTMTAEALACRFLLKEEVAPETIEEAMSLIRQNPPSENEVNYYYWYYATMAAHHSGGRHWTEWNDRLKPVLLARQVRSGPEAGSWPADGLWSGYGGTIYSTAMATLCLEAYYRYVSIEQLKK
jgi:hypothetical protein